jgi:hypothetical protein
MTIDISHDLPLVDGTETITLHSQLLQDSVSVAGVLREEVSENERTPLHDGLVLSPVDTAFTLPSVNLQGFIPAIADRLTDSSGIEWMILSVRLTLLTRNYHLLCRKQR